MTPDRRTGRLLAIGETMGVVAPAVRERLAEAELFRLDAGGAESNVAAHVAALGHPAAWFSRVGNDPVGARILRQLAERGVDVALVEVDPDNPTGLYLKDPGYGVTYYRSGSAACQLGPDDADRIAFDGVAVAHVSGITAAISACARDFLTRVMERAHRAGVAVSFDVNHRAPLWEARSAAPVLLDLARRADLVFVGRDEAETLWGTSTPAEVRALLASVPQLVVKDGAVGATAYTSEREWFQPSLRVVVVDLVGAGDAFAGGYLAATLADAPIEVCLRAGHERAALTIQTTGDSVDGTRRHPGPAGTREAHEDGTHHHRTEGVITQ